jgi:precorrin-2 dehydrogenase / sirohydrochlorin ferrochelatase
MISYPIHLNIASRLCVVVGGGSVAERKVLGLLEAGASIRVVSPIFTALLQEYFAQEQFEGIFTKYAPHVLDGAFLVFAATNDPVVNSQIIADAKERGILTNSADAPDTGDFVTPATIRRGELLLTVATGGNTPALSAQIVRDLETEFGEEYAAFVELLGQKRDYVKKATRNLALRKTALTALVQARAELLEWLRNGNPGMAEAYADQILEGALTLASDSDRTEPP